MNAVDADLAGCPFHRERSCERCHGTLRGHIRRALGSPALAATEPIVTIDPAVALARIKL